MLNQSKKGFLKKGGLCTEFTDKNKWFIELSKKNEDRYINMKNSKNSDKREFNIPESTSVKKKKQNLDKNVNYDRAKEISENKLVYKLKSKAIQPNGINK